MAIKCCRGGRGAPSPWLSPGIWGWERTLLKTRSDSHPPEYMAHVWEGRNIRDLKQRRFQVPVNASEVVFGGVSHLFLLGILLPESHTVGLAQPDSALSYFGFTPL